MRHGTKRARSPEADMLDIYRELFPQWSLRDVARYHRAMQTLDDIGYQRDDVLKVIREATLPNGTISLTRFVQLANAALLHAKSLL